VCAIEASCYNVPTGCSVRLPDCETLPHNAPSRLAGAAAAASARSILHYSERVCERGCVAEHTGRCDCGDKYPDVTCFALERSPYTLSAGWRQMVSCVIERGERVWQCVNLIIARTRRAATKRTSVRNKRSPLVASARGLPFEDKTVF
jgi:hypothetical protein